MGRVIHYTLLDKESEPELEKCAVHPPLKHDTSRLQCHLSLERSINCLLLMIILLLSLILYRKPTDKQCAAQTSIWCQYIPRLPNHNAHSNESISWVHPLAPMLDAVEYHELEYTNTFNSTSIYRGPPTHDVEAAWTKLTVSTSPFLSVSHL